MSTPAEIIPSAAPVPSVGADLKDNHDIENDKSKKKESEKLREPELHTLVRAGSIEPVRDYLAKAKAHKPAMDINAVDLESHNALWIAAWALNEEMADLLLENGITVIQNLQALQGKTEFVVDTALKALLQTPRPEPITSKVIETHTNLFSKFKEHLNHELKRLSVRGELSLQKDGSLCVKPKLPSPLEIEGIIKNKEEVKLFAGDKEILLAYKGYRSSPGIRKTYYVPPLFFFTPHIDDTTYKLIVRNFEFFRRLGYSKLCFEFDFDKKLDEVIKNFSAVKNEEYRKTLDKNDIQELTINLEFLSQVKTQSAWLSYEGIDLDFGSARVSQSSRKAIASDAKMTKKRDEFMAKRIEQITSKAQGGTITLLGTAHQGVLPALVAHASEFAFQFQVYSYYDSNNMSEEDKLAVALLASVAGNCGTSSANFGFKTTKLDAAEKAIPVLDQTLQRNVLLSAFDMEPNNVLTHFTMEPRYSSYLKAENQQTHKITFLQKILDGLPFVAGIDTESGRADALLYLNSSESFRQAEELIRKRIKLVQPIQSYNSQSKEGKLVLVIPNINAENEPAIAEAYENLASKEGKRKTRLN